MAEANILRVRRSITDLLVEHTQGKKAPLDNLIRAWDGIQKLPPSDCNSFFKIAGYHGEPFRGAGWGNAAWWGGYCHHGNVLFPTWHRSYLLRLEDALRSIDGCGDVTLPYWNELGVETLLYGVPRIFLDTKYTFANGTTIKNPLRSYVFQKAIFDNLDPVPDADYSKPADYETVRYPFSGLVGSKDAQKTKEYNAQLEAKGKEETDKMLNENVESWLNNSIKNSDGDTILTHTSWKYSHCLRADNYTVFSNNTSATQWNEEKYAVKKWTPSDEDKDCEPVVSLESPHNDIHLAVGGFNLPGFFNVDSADASDANGDMGENDTAAFDPIFFFHHCFIDKVFWTWQQIKGCTAELKIMDKYPGTNSVDSQGPTPGVPGNAWLTMKTPLDPFVKKDGSPMTSEDVVDIEGQLGYQYKAPGTGSSTPSEGPSIPHEGSQLLMRGLLISDQGSLILDPKLKFPDPLPGKRLGRPQAPPRAITPLTPIIRISGVSRASISGSFTLEVLDKEGNLLGVESILSRWKVSGCGNCQTHLNVKTFVALLGYTGDGDVQVNVRTRDQPQLHHPHGARGPLTPRFHFVHGPNLSLTQL